jgi:predicted Rdx family selenoprotein
MKIGLIIIFFSYTLCNVYDGYTLYTSEPDYTIYLIDNDLNVVNEWYADCKPKSMGYLLSDSTLVYPCQQDELVIDPTSAASGRIIKFDWDGNVLWDWQCDWEYQLHHDIEPLPNGNILAIAKEDIDGFRPDVILEIEPVGLNDANLVWSWKVSEHMSEELDNPYTFYTHADYNQLDWNHFNAINLNEYGKILLSSRNWGEIYVIEWGGNNDLLYRWGNPQNYGRDGEQILFAPHGVNQIPIGYPGEDNIILFNNMDIQGGDNDNSVVMEFTPPTDYYIEDEESFGPTEPTWTFEEDFFSQKQSGAFRLPNGNTFVSVSQSGDMFEVTYGGEIVWEHQTQGVFARAQKYSMDYLNILGDVNSDGIINVLDVVMIVNIVLNNEYNALADLNSDGTIDVLDIVQLVNIILN